MKARRLQEVCCRLEIRRTLRAANNNELYLHDHNNIDLARAKSEAPANKFIIQIKQ